MPSEKEIRQWQHNKTVRFDSHHPVEHNQGIIKTFQKQAETTPTNQKREDERIGTYQNIPEELRLS